MLRGKRAGHLRHDLGAAQAQLGVFGKEIAHAADHRRLVQTRAAGGHLAVQLAMEGLDQRQAHPREFFQLRSLHFGQVEELPAEEIAANFDRYQNRYGTAEASRG